MNNDGFILTQRLIGPWTVPVIELAGSTKDLHLPVSGVIINSITDGQRGRERQQGWKVAVASRVKAERGAEPWLPQDSYAISLSFCFHSGNHGNRPLDVENFVKPVVDALAAGLFCPPEQNPQDIASWKFDDSNFNTLLIHRLEDAPRREDEGIAIGVSARPRSG